MLVSPAAQQPTSEEAFAHCRRVALGHYENFGVASALLPARLRPHLYAVYAYCRGVDDLGDEAPGDRLALLDEWESDLHRCYGGSPRDIRFVALQQTVREFGLPPEPFLRLIEANRRDQCVKRYETFEDLVEYCSFSANPVGELVLRLFGYSDARRRRLSDATCTALQLANFWQDVSRDLDAGRIYIPAEDMRRFGVSESDLLEKGCTPGFRALMAFEVARTREYFREGLRLPPIVSGRLRFDLRLFSLGGLAVLDAIEGLGYDVLRRRPTVSGRRKALIVLRGLVPVPIRVRG